MSMTETRPIPDAADPLANFYDAHVIPTDTGQLEHERRLLAGAVLGLATARPSVAPQLDTVTEIIDWEFFAPSGTQPPEGLSLVSTDETHRTPTHVESIAEGLPPTELARIEFSLLQQAGYKQLLTTRRNRADTHTDELHEALRANVTSTPTYRVLRSICLPLVTGDRPLNMTERMIREVQIQAAIRAEFRMPAGEPIRRHTPAGDRLERELRQMEAETVQRKTPTGAGSFAKAQTFFRSKIRQFAGQEDSRVAEETGNMKAAASAEDLGEMDEQGEVRPAALAYVLAEDLVDELGPPWIANSRQATLYFLKDLIRGVFGQPPDGSFTEYLREQVEARLPKLAATIKENLELVATSLPAVELKQPAGPLSEPVSITYPDIMRIPLGNVITFNNRKEIRELEHQTKAWVLEGADRMPGPTPRLVSQQSRSEQLPPVRGSSTALIIKFAPDTLSQDTMPQVPGYVVTGYDPQTETYSLEPDPAGDPYTEALIPVSQEKLSDLVKTYQKIGLDRLVASLQAQTDLTVEDLRRTIAKTSVYPKYFFPALLSQTASNVMEGLEDFRDIVIGGRLYIQCDSAGLFLKMSLAKLFDEDSVGTQVGLVIAPGAKKIDGVQHMQTLLIHEDRLSMLDSTPYSRIPSLRSLRGVTAGPASVKPYEIDLSTPKFLPTEAHLRPAPEPLSEVERADALERAGQHIQEQLALVLDTTSNDELYTRVRSLTDRNPLYQALRVALKAANGSIDNDEATQTYHFLKALSDAAPEALHRLRLQAYSPEFLEQLADSVARIARILER
jgi:hypothetical protein